MPESALETEAALRVGVAIHAEGYEVEPSPRKNGADFGALRHGSVWATFHLDVDPRRPLFLRLGATVFGGARQDATGTFPYDDAATYTDGRVERFVSERLALACRRGLEQDPRHCDACPRGERHRAGDWSAAPPSTSAKPGES
jgi:hypothetical protein